MRPPPPTPPPPPPHPPLSHRFPTLPFPLSPSPSKSDVQHQKTKFTIRPSSLPTGGSKYGHEFSTMFMQQQQQQQQQQQVSNNSINTQYQNSVGNISVDYHPHNQQQQLRRHQQDSFQPRQLPPPPHVNNEANNYANSQQPFHRQVPTLIQHEFPTARRPPPPQQPTHVNIINNMPINHNHQYSHQHQDYVYIKSQYPEEININKKTVLPPCCPPIFTRPQSDGERNIDNTAVPKYYPKGCWTDDDPRRNEVPPPADSRFITVDDGNAGPDFIRSTMYRLPSDRYVLRSAVGNNDDAGGRKHDYMAVFCSPLALPSSDSCVSSPTFVHDCGGVHKKPYLPDSVPIGNVPVDFTTNRDSPPRCNRCFAYINPYWSRLKCNFCGASIHSRSNATQSRYGDKVGTVEYPVQGPYITRNVLGPVRPNWIFCIDLTCPLVKEYVDLVLDELWPALSNLVSSTVDVVQNQHGRAVIVPRVALVFVCVKGIYIPKKASGEAGSLPRDGFIVMPDVLDEEAFNPAPLSEWSWSVPDEYDEMQDLWTQRICPVLLPQLISHAKSCGGYSKSVGGAALQFLVAALEQSGGRAVFWTWRRPNFGHGTLANREQVDNRRRRSSISSNETSLHMPIQDSMVHTKVKNDPNLKSAAIFYSALGERCAKAKVAIDIVLHTNSDVPQSFIDVATMGRLCETSGGRFIWLDKVSYEPTDVWKRAIREELMRPMYLSGCDVIFKIRCSQGLRIRSILSSIGDLKPSSGLGQEDELELSCVTPETCFGVTLEHRVGGIPLPNVNKFAFVQTALLYTNPWTGDRRIRISTLGIRVTTDPSLVLAAMDFGALACLQLRLNFPHSNYSSLPNLSLETTSHAVNALNPDQKGDTMISDARQDFFSSMRQILVAHWKLGSKRSIHRSGQILIPDALRLWPLFVLSAAKSPLLRPSVASCDSPGTRTDQPSPSGDERAYFIYHARKVSPSAAMLLVSPLVLDIGESLGLYTNRSMEHDGQEIASFEWKKIHGERSSISDHMSNLRNGPVCDLPTPIPASISNLAEDGIYLVDTCFSLFVVLQQDIDKKYEDLNEELETKVRDTVQQIQIWSQVGKEFRCQRPSTCLPVIVVRQKVDVARYQSILQFMVLDATQHDKDFANFCLSLIQQINKRV